MNQQTVILNTRRPRGRARAPFSSARRSVRAALLGAVALATVVVLGAGCDSTVAADAAQVETPALASAAGAVTSTSPVFTFPAIGPHDGVSRVTRTKNGANFRFTTNGLEPGHAYTLWVVIWNEPENCVDGCDGFDLFTEAALPDMLYGAGNVVGGSGQATFSGRISVGDASGSVQAPLGLAANGLMNPYDAEIHFIVKDHGPKLPAYMPDMIRTLAGGCADPGIPMAGVSSPWNDYDGPEYGERGPNPCEDILASVHQP